MQDDAHRSTPTTTDRVIDAVDGLTGDVAAPVVDPAGEWRWKRGDTWRVVVAGLIVVIGGIAASRGVPSWERAAFLKLNGAPDALYPVLWLPMQFGAVLVATAAAGAASLLIRSRRSAIVLLATPVVAWTAARLVKEVVRRGRPVGVGLSVIQRGAAESGLGYASGHTAVAFALVGALSAHLRRPWPAVLLALATVVGVARVYVGAHLPLDVIGGAACGLLVGEAARVIELRARRRGAGTGR